jgi:hypothetical protein
MGSGAVRVPRAFIDLAGTAAVSQGGTGAATAADARAALGAAALAANSLTDTQSISLAGKPASKGIVVAPDGSQTANLIDCGTFYVRPDGGHVVTKDWDQLASDAPLTLAGKTHPNRKLYCGYVDASNLAIISAFDGDAGVYTPIDVNCSYLSLNGYLQAQHRLYAATQAADPAENCVDVLHHAQQGTGSDVGYFATAIHNYTDGNGLCVDMVGSGSGMLIRHAHNATSRPDKPSNYIGTGTFIEAWQLQSDLSTWDVLFKLDANACGIWYSDWSDGLPTDAPVQLRSLTHPNRVLYAGYRDAVNGATIGAIDLDAGAFTPLTVRASVLSFTDGVIGLKVYTVATLPVSPDAGSKAFVNDATAPTFLGTLTGGGSTVCPVFFDGSVWRAG